MKKLIIIALSLSPLITTAAWNVISQNDELTDETRFAIICDGKPYTVSSGFGLSETPHLIFAIEPIKVLPEDKLLTNQRLYVKLISDGVARSGTDVTYRIGTNAVQTVHCKTSDDRRSLFFNTDLLAEIEKQNKFVVRFETTLGAVRTLTFNTTGATEAKKKMKAQAIAYLRSR